MTFLRLLLASLFLAGPAATQAAPLNQCQISAALKATSCSMPCCKTKAAKSCPMMKAEAPQDQAFVSGASISMSLKVVGIAVSPAPLHPFTVSLLLAPYASGPPGPWRSLTYSGLSPPTLA